MDRNMGERSWVESEEERSGERCEMNAERRRGAKHSRHKGIYGGSQCEDAQLLWYHTTTVKHSNFNTL